jgi:hypothetical protein
MRRFTSSHEEWEDIENEESALADEADLDNTKPFSQIEAELKEIFGL